MTSTQQRGARPGGGDPASRGLILVAVAVVLGLIVLVKGGGVGFERTGTAVDVPEGEVTGTTTTTAPAPTTTAAPAVPPSSVKVVVANGSGTSGLARTVSRTLASAGFTSSTATDAVSQASATTVYFAQGFETSAQAIGQQLGLDASRVQALPAGASLAKVQPDDVGVVVVLGPDATASSGGSATTTTTTG